MELTNGTVDTLRKFDSSQLPIANHTFVAPFYADIDASGICGDIIYNTDITKERDALQKAADQISNGFSEYEDFMPEYLILAMWYNVGYADQPNDDDKVDDRLHAIYVAFSFAKVVRVLIPFIYVGLCMPSQSHTPVN